jgi:hypothetical protein
MPATAKTNLPNPRRALCLELIGIHKGYAEVFAREDAIKAELKKLAGDAGANFKEEFPAEGSVSVSAPKKGTFKGSFAVLVAQAWLALKPAEQKKLKTQGLVVIEDKYGGDYYGAVTVKTF